MLMQLHEFIDLLEAKGLKPRQLSNGQWLAHCPAHSDEQPSLSVAESSDRILLHCFAGCDATQICHALGISVSALFHGEKPNEPLAIGCRIHDLVDECEFLHQTLVQLGCREVLWGDRQVPAVAFPLTTPEGQTFFHLRIAPEGRDKWRLQPGSPAKRLLFAFSHAIERAQQTRTLLITESPLDAAVLYACGFAATSTIGKANASALTEFRHLIPAEIAVYAWVEPDADKFARDVADALRRPVFAFASPNPQAKDAWRVLRANHWDIQRTRDQIAAAMAQAIRVIPTPQTLSEILEATATFVRQFVVLTPEQADTVALWVAHTWVIAATDVTPYLRINSATKRCGKTRLAEIIACLAKEPKFTTCLSTAALFRLAHQSQGEMTLIVDEVEGTFSSKEKAGELTALLNAGWRRGLTVPRVEKTKEGWRVFEFQTFCPKVLVGLGKLADTVEDRAIHIVLERKRPDETVRDFQWADAQAEAQPIREALERWANNPQTIAALRLSRPLMPRHISDRAREGWRLLIAIADMAGNGWSERARKAMEILEQAREDPAFNVRLLEALRQIFTERKAERLTVAEICQALTEMDDPPIPEDFWRWVAASDWRRAGAWLARTLKPFGVRPRKVRVGNETKQGYELGDFADAFARYLSPLPTNSAPDFNPSTPTPTSAEEASVPFVPFAAEQTEREKPNKNWACSIVPFVPFPMEKDGNFPNDLPQNEVGSSDYPSLAENSPNSLTQAEKGSEETDIVPLGNGTNRTTEQPQQNPNKQRSFRVPFAQPQNGTNGTLENSDLVKVACPTCGSSRRVPPDALMLADPRCHACGSVMQLAPEDDPPPDPSPSPEPAQSESGERYIDTEEWIDEWWREVAGDQVVVDLESDEPTPVGNLAPPTDREACCPRCGHRETVDLEVLLPPLCPVCDAPMDWVSDTASTDDTPLVGAIERITDLSKRLRGDRR